MASNTPIQLTKGENINLTKTDSLLRIINVGLGWDIKTGEKGDETFDLDASIIMLGEDGKVRSNADFIYYHHKDSVCGSIHHTGDNRTGEGDGDDETIQVFLDKVPTDVFKLVVCVSIDDAEKKKQNFGQVSNAFVRLVNSDTQNEVARFDLTENASTKTAMIFAEIYRYDGEWKFKAIEQGFASLVELLRFHGATA